MAHRLYRFLLLCIAGSIVLLAGWANYSSYSSFKDRFHNDIKAGARTVETLLDRDPEISVSDLWHILNFLKKREIKYFELLDDQNNQLFQHGETDIAAFSVYQLELKNRGKKYGHVRYVVDEEEIARLFLLNNWVYVVISFLSALVFGLIGPIVLIQRERRQKKALDDLAIIESPNIAEKLAFETRDKTVRLLALRIKKVLEKYENQRSELERTIHEKIRFEAISQTTQMIAHDLKNPINTIEMLLHCKDWDEYLRNLPSAMASFTKLLTMIDLFSRAESVDIVRPTLTI